MNQRAAIVGVLTLLVAAAAAAFVLLKPAPKPNVLILLWDTTRADHMSVYGYDRATTPTLERLAESATVYDHAISPAMWTVPSHGSLFTGLPVTTHGCHGEYKWLDHHHTTLAEHFGAHGYSTFMWTANIFLADRTNLTQGFQTYAAAGEPPYKGKSAKATRRKKIKRDASSEISPRNPNGTPNEGWGKAAAKDSSRVANQAVLHWIDQQQADGKPWLAFMNLMEAHSPRIPSMKARKALLDDDMIELGLKTDVRQVKVNGYTFGFTDYDREEIAAIRGVYDATLLELDASLDQLLKGLEERGVLDDTIVVITSDHGESLGEHKQFEHKFVLYEPLVHVPLVIHYPKKLKAERVKHPVSTSRLFATLNDLAGLPTPGTLPESSLRQSTAADPAFAEIVAFEPKIFQRFKPYYPGVDWKPWMRTFRAVVQGDHKLIHASDGAHELYDLSTDDGELTNLAGNSNAQPELCRTLEGWYQRIDKYDADKRTEGDMPISFDKAGREELCQLGYLANCGDDDEGEALPSVQTPDVVHTCP